MLKVSFDEKKQYLAAIASKVFCEKGYWATSLADIARKANVTKAAIYYYFPAKEDILGYLLIKEIDRFLKIVQQGIIENKENGLDQKRGLENLIRTYAHFLNLNKEVRLLALRERHQLTGKYKRKLLEREQRIFHLLKHEIKGIRGISKKIDPTIISFLIIAISHWLGYWYSERKALTLEEIINQNIRLIFDGIFKDGR